MAVALTCIPPLHRGETVERPLSDHNILTDLSTVFQWALSDLQGLPWFLNDISVNAMVAITSPWSPSNFELVQKQSLSGLWGKRTFNEYSAISQQALNGLTSLSMISQQSVKIATFWVNSLVHSVISVGRTWSLRDLSWALRVHRWSHNERWMNSQWLHVGLSSNAQRSPRSLRSPS